MSKIEGIPDGWELVRIGRPKIGETVITDDGKLHTFRSDTATSVNYPIIRRIPPPLSIPPKAFKDGWIVGQSTGPVLWSETKPKHIENVLGWPIENGTFLPVGIMPCVKFDPLLPESERICRVTWEHGSECEQT